MNRTQPVTDLEKLHADVAAFNEEMRQANHASYAPAASRRSPWPFFGLGAGAALAAIAAALLLIKL